MISWLEIDTQQLKDNIRCLREYLGEGNQIMAVVKANAYGHGLAQTAKIIALQGIEYFAVASLDEGVALRESGINTPILLLGYFEEMSLYDIIHYKITPTIYDFHFAKALSKAAIRYREIIKAHIKIDTGMHRFGFLSSDALEAMEAIDNLPGIKIEGLYSHFANVNDREFSDYQYRQMTNILLQAQRANQMGFMTHMANSQATFFFAKAHFDMVRVGRAIYGLMMPERGFKPVLSLKTKLVSIKNVPANETVGYCRTYTTDRPSVVGVLPVGYADGYARSLSNRGMVLINGQKCSVIGRVCMNHTIVDITDLHHPNIGDEVVLIGSQGEKEISVMELADWMGTIEYEVLARLAINIPRKYT